MHPSPPWRPDLARKLISPLKRRRTKAQTDNFYENRLRKNRDPNHFRLLEALLMRQFFSRDSAAPNAF